MAECSVNVCTNYAFFVSLGALTCCVHAHASIISSYIGNTTTSLSRRLTTHLQNGSIKNHTRDSHNTTLTRDMLVDNTIILDSAPDVTKLHYLEAIYINLYKPYINVQGGVGTITLPSDRVVLIPTIEWLWVFVCVYIYICMDVCMCLQVEYSCVCLLMLVYVDAICLRGEGGITVPVCHCWCKWVYVYTAMYVGTYVSVCMYFCTYLSFVHAYVYFIYTVIHFSLLCLLTLKSCSYSFIVVLVCWGLCSYRHIMTLV